MRTALRILSFYTIAIVLLTVVIPMLTGIADYEDFDWMRIVAFLPFIPVLALVFMMLLGIKRRPTRTTVLILTSLIAAFILYVVVSGFILLLDPARVILSILYVPVVAFTGLVLIALKRNVISIA